MVTVAAICAVLDYIFKNSECAAQHMCLSTHPIDVPLNFFPHSALEALVR